MNKMISSARSMKPEGSSMDRITKPNDTLQRVKKALELGGYCSDGIIWAQFCGWTDTLEVHAIKFKYDGGVSDGCVYIDHSGKGDF